MTAEKAVKKGFSAVESGRGAIDDIRRGNIMGAIEQGKTAVEDAKSAIATGK